MKTLKFQIVGVSPLIMHNGRLADPSDSYTRAIKEISGKRKKTDADYEEMARLEYLGGLYMLDSGPCIPSYVFEACLIGKGGAARKESKGKEAAAALWVTEDFPLVYDGPRDMHELWKTGAQFRIVAPVRVGQARVMRTRAMFDEWSAEISFGFNPNLLNEDMVRTWPEIAGEQVGLMDWRPKFGRFRVVWPD